jgi:hypothetical protein
MFDHFAIIGVGIGIRIGALFGAVRIASGSIVALRLMLA